MDIFMHLMFQFWFDLDVACAFEGILRQNGLEIQKYRKSTYLEDNMVEC